MRLVLCWALIAALFCPNLAARVVAEEAISIGTKLTISSKVLDENRQVLVYKPNALVADQKYQVVYLLDAEYLFTSTVGIVDALVTAGQIPPTIIVGVETTVRVRDYLPPIKGEPQSRQQKWIKRKFPLYGGTGNFTELLQTELFPHIENSYSVQPTRTLIGYSNGGVFGLHTLVNEPEVFTNYLLISPAAWWGVQEIDRNLEEFSENYSSYAGNLYLTVAGEGQGMYSNALRIASNLETAAMPSFKWTFKQLEKESHQSTIYPSIYQGLVELFKDLKFEVSEQHGKFASFDDIKRYYAGLSKRYGYQVTIPAKVFSELADKQFTYQRDLEAIKTLKRFVDTHPASSFAYSDLGRGYMRTKQYKLAKLNFEKAISIVKRDNTIESSVLDFLQDMVNLAESNI